MGTLSSRQSLKPILTWLSRVGDSSVHRPGGDRRPSAPAVDTGRVPGCLAPSPTPVPGHITLPSLARLLGAHGGGVTVTHHAELGLRLLQQAILLRRGCTHEDTHGRAELQDAALQAGDEVAEATDAADAHNRLWGHASRPLSGCHCQGPPRLPPCPSASGAPREGWWPGVGMEMLRPRAGHRAGGGYLAPAATSPCLSFSCAKWGTGRYQHLQLTLVSRTILPHQMQPYAEPSYINQTTAKLLWLERRPGGPACLPSCLQMAHVLTGSRVKVTDRVGSMVPSSSNVGCFPFSSEEAGPTAEQMEDFKALITHVLWSLQKGSKE